MPGTDSSSNEPLRVPPVLAASPAFQPASEGDWGFWATIGLGLAIEAGMILGQGVGAVVFVIFAAARGQKLDPATLVSNGLLLSMATLFALPVTLGLCWLFAHLQTKQHAADYLAIKRTGWRAYVWGFGGLAGILVIWTGMVNVFHVPEVAPFVIEAYRTAGNYPLLWFALVVAAPIMEETLFRGFLFQGLFHSRAGAAGAILIPSGLWAALHVQYGLHEIVLIFLLGILLGALRWKSGSILPGVLIHAFSNLASTAEVALLQSGP